MMTAATRELSDRGVSIWLDDINRENIEDGKLAALFAKFDVVGVTTNPSIFGTAIGQGHAYDDQVAELAGHKTGVEDALYALTTQDVGDAADLLRPVYEGSDGYDGRVSIEVTPGSAHDTAATVVEAKRLWASLARPNIMIKIPATNEGLPAITEALAAGISVNVTLIFGLNRYRQVIDAYLDGIEQAAANGLDIGDIHSVASFFVSRVDTEVNRRLGGTQTTGTLINQAGVANAQLAYQLFKQAFTTDRAAALLRAGANLQRPLWASTGVKTDDLSSTHYVTNLIAPGTVNTMPEKTLRAVAEATNVEAVPVEFDYAAASVIMVELARAGIDLTDVETTLEREGVAKFADAWAALTSTVRANLVTAAGQS